MKWIKYKREIKVITKNDSLQDPFLQEEMRSFSDETKDAIVEKVSEIAYNGEYTIEDDGEPEHSAEPTQLDRVEAQATYTAMMTDTLLEEE